MAELTTFDFVNVFREVSKDLNPIPCISPSFRYSGEMRRTSRYFDLTWIASCKWPINSFYEPIAAFSDPDSALAYMHKVHSKNEGRYAYQVEERKGKGKYEVASKVG